jgi:hypothetical protein
LKISVEAQNFWLFFRGKSYELVFAKKWLGYTLGEFFSPTHQVTLLRFF